MPHLYAGASGFAYPAWKPDFYPKNVPQARFLQHYATRLNSVEINYTFRRSASESTLAKWLDTTPEGFQFSVKAHQRITHFARLKVEEAEPTEFFLRSIEPLRAAGRLGSVLFQLPPNMKLDLERLRAFLKLLPSGIRATFEFRHESWFDEAVYAALRDHNAALCQAESDELTVPEVVAADFVYMRLRKTAYGEADRIAIGNKVEGLLSTGKDVFLYFKHEDTPEGALYAEDLLRGVSTHD
ncbi:MAG: DUF72 domain-containing protein [Acidobacteria bacterium]|nr:DUF72 domain-containing protein [Acidobacteriota bacterium]MDA1236021.1 DUF72 domain-containing protein [Acidobacteriota bacterium]